MARSFFALCALTVGLAGCSEPSRVVAPTPANDTMMAMDMPDGSPVDMAMLPLFPGAKMIDMKIMPHMPDDEMAMNFDAPADVASVRDWYAAELAKKGFRLTANATGLAGTDPSGNNFRLVLQAAPGGHTLGMIGKE